MSQHLDQIASSVQRAVQDVITRGLQDPRVRGLISITRVEVTPDLADATVYVSVLPAEQETLTLHGLRAASTHIRSRMSRTVQLRRMPRLHFRLDQSLKKQASIYAALADDRVQQDLEPVEPLLEMNDEADQENDHARDHGIDRRNDHVAPADCNDSADRNDPDGSEEER